VQIQFQTARQACGGLGEEESKLDYHEEFQCPCCGKKTTLTRNVPLTVNIFNESFLLRLWTDIKALLKTLWFIFRLPLSFLYQSIETLRVSDHVLDLKRFRSKR
jgi:hypothetical protein